MIVINKNIKIFKVKDETETCSSIEPQKAFGILQVYRQKCTCFIIIHLYNHNEFKYQTRQFRLSTHLKLIMCDIILLFTQ